MGKEAVVPTTAVVPAEAARPTSASHGGGGGASSQERSRVCAELAREVGGFRDVLGSSWLSRHRAVLNYGDHTITIHNRGRRTTLRATFLCPSHGSTKGVLWDLEAHA